MHSFIKSNIAIKDLYCETIYKNYIAETSEFLSKCEELSNILRIKLPTGCYTNFRDAIFHFRRLVKSSEENEITRQGFAVEEHSNRAKTDAIVCILENCSLLLQVFSHAKYSLSAEASEELVTMKNSLDRSALHLRLNGIMLDHTNILRISDEEFQNSIRSFLLFVRKYLGQEKLKLAIEEIKASNPRVKRDQ